jgi:AbrB family looped-hinge helix DNA binding protein
MSVVKVSQKGQIVIPSPLRKKYGIHPQSKVMITEMNGKIVILPTLKDPGPRGPWPAQRGEVAD